jgi:hypothetical protein
VAEGRHRALGTAIAMLIIVTSVGACAVPPPTSSPITPHSVTAIPHVDSGTGLKLPSEAFNPTATERNLVIDASQKRIAVCMSEYGLTWKAAPGRMPQINQLDRLYGVSDLDVARSRGYHLPPEYRVSPLGDHRQPGPVLDRTMSPAELLVLTGSPTGEETTASPGTFNGKQLPFGGCGARARLEVTGVDQIDPTFLADSITVKAWQESKTHPQVVAVIAEWSRCMKTAGYDFPTPLEVESPAWSLHGPVTEAEIATAVADVRCKQQTNLIGIWFAVESDYENQIIPQHLDDLQRIKAAWTDAARRAAQILGTA